MEVPKMAAMTIMPNSAAPMSLKALAKGELRRTLPLLLPIVPKLSDATERKENVNQIKK